MIPGSGKILLAEDNDDDAYLTQHAMESAGISHFIQRCRDGREVVEYLEGLLSATEVVQSPDLILMDLKMPRFSGLETLKWIREQEIFSTLIVLALTSSSEERDVKSAYELHVNAYLVKPSSLSEMIEVGRAIRCFWLDRNLIKPHLPLPEFRTP